MHTDHYTHLRNLAKHATKCGFDCYIKNGDVVAIEVPSDNGTMTMYIDTFKELITIINRVERNKQCQQT